MWMLYKIYQFVIVIFLSWNVGCGGIDLFMGGFLFINKEQFVVMLCNIGFNVLGYGFKLVIQNLCLICDNVMQVFQVMVQQINW